MSEELKPCPFCGGKAVIEVIEPHRHIICKMPVYKGEHLLNAQSVDALSVEKRKQKRLKSGTGE